MSVLLRGLLMGWKSQCASLPFSAKQLSHTSPPPTWSGRRTLPKRLSSRLPNAPVQSDWGMDWGGFERWAETLALHAAGIPEDRAGCVVSGDWNARPPRSARCQICQRGSDLEGLVWNGDTGRLCGSDLTSSWWQSSSLYSFSIVTKSNSHCHIHLGTRDAR